MTDIQVYTPLSRVEAILRRDKIRFHRRTDGIISIMVPSLRAPIEYTVEFGIHTLEFPVGMVLFGLPLEVEDIERLVSELDSKVGQIMVASYSKPCLIVANFVSSESLHKDVELLRDWCDSLYPLITRIRAARRWNSTILNHFAPLHATRH